jgi:hypothetical protein
MKKLIGYFFISAIIFGIFCFQNINANAQSTKRIVSLVYDDSGSMFIDQSLKWCRANYAIQAFGALLGDEDVLFVTYMSSYKRPIKFDIARGVKRQWAINKIRNNIFYTKETPFESVQQAVKVFDEYDLENDDIEYWLVIITDGIFFEKDNGTKLNSEVEKLIKKGKENKREFRIIYIGIGQDALKLKKDNNKIYSKVVLGEGIAEELQEAAGIISGKTIIQSKKYSIKNDEVIINNYIPLSNLVVLHQKNSTSILDAKINDKDLDFKEEYKIKYSNAALGYNIDRSLEGSITYLKSKNDIIQDGLIKVQYAEEVKKENITILFDPAVQMDFEYYRNGQLIAQNDIHVGEEILVKIILKESNTGKLINKNNFEKDLKYSFEFNTGGEIINLDDKGCLVEVKEQDISISAECSLDGYFNIRKSQNLKVKDYKTIVVEEADSTAWTVKLESLNYENKAKFYLATREGKDLTKEELDKLSIQVDTKEKILFDIEINEDSSFYIVPKYWYQRFMTSAGKIDMVISGDFEEGEFGNYYTQIFVEDISLFQRFRDLIYASIVTIIIVLYIVGVFKKPRFDKSSTYMEYSRVKYIAGIKQEGKTMTMPFSTNFFTRWFLPYVPEKYELNGLTIHAGKKRGYVVIPTYAQHKKLRIDGIILDDEIKKPYRINSETIIEYLRGDTIERYVYKV